MREGSTNKSLAARVQQGQQTEARKEASCDGTDGQQGFQAGVARHRGRGGDCRSERGRDRDR